MLYFYYRQWQRYADEAIQAIEKSLEVGLPPVLLTPLYWLEKDRPEVFVSYAQPLLDGMGL
jgi:hypothetical protein